MAQQGPPPQRPSRLSAPRRNGQQWNEADYPEEDDELPPWAGLGIRPNWADRDQRAGPDDVRLPDDDGGPAAGGRRAKGRLAATRARKSRRSFYRWVVLIIAVALIAGGGWEFFHRSKSAAPLPGQIVTKYLPGEITTVPGVCQTVTASTLNQYLPGKRTTAAPGSLGASSLCGWTLDARPRYRLLNVQAQAYAPNGLAGGDGSATFAAIDAYDQVMQQKADPPRRSGLPKAKVIGLPGIASAAFAALQVVTKGGDTTDIVTIVVRDHNVLITSVLEGIERSSHGGYGPVSPTQLKAGALAAARDVLAKVGS